MRTVFATLLVMHLFGMCPWAAYAGSITLGGATFDFDAPAPPLTPAQQAFYEKYKNAVNGHSEAELLALQDASVKTCKFTAPDMLMKKTETFIPADARVRFFPATQDMAKAMGLGDMAYLAATPTGALGIDISQKLKGRIQLQTIIRPIRQTGETITLVPYCLTDKGKARMEEKKAEEAK